METALHTAVKTLLSAGLVPSVYDAVPQPSDAGSAAQFPYVTIGESTFAAAGYDDGMLTECTLSIHVWSRYRGYKEIRGLQAQIYALLHRQDFAVTGYTLVNCEWEFTEQSFLDADGVTRHGVQRFRILLDAT